MRRGAALATVAVALLALAAWLGSRELVGTFGVTGLRKSCGSVWGLLFTDDLNAATCTNDLRGRLSLVAGFLAASLLAALVPAALALAPRLRPERRRLLVGSAIALPLLSGLAMVVIGRHLIWSVSGA